MDNIEHGLFVWERICQDKALAKETTEIFPLEVYENWENNTMPGKLYFKSEKVLNMEKETVHPFLRQPAIYFKENSNVPVKHTPLFLSAEISGKKYYLYHKYHMYGKIKTPNGMLTSVNILPFSKEQYIDFLSRHSDEDPSDGLDEIETWNVFLFTPKCEEKFFYSDAEYTIIDIRTKFDLSVKLRPSLSQY